MRTPATPEQLEQWAELDDADASYFDLKKSKQLPM